MRWERGSGVEKRDAEEREKPDLFPMVKDTDDHQNPPRGMKLNVRRWTRLETVVMRAINNTRCFIYTVVIMRLFHKLFPF